MSLSYLSVCSGIEAATVAWHPLGFRPLAFSEIEPFACAVLSHHYPDVPLCGDFTRLRDEDWIADADLLVGGTPCQGFSIAGLRRSLDDARGNLTLEFLRLADAIDERRAERGLPPCIIVWENVPGVLSVRDNAFGCFLSGLSGEDTPFIPPRGKWTNAGVAHGPARAVAWRILDAQYFGLAQRRRRVFVVASARKGFDPAAVLLEFEGLRRDTPPRREAWKDPASSAASSANQRRSHWDGVEQPHPTLNQSFNTGAIGYSNQELFSQRGAGLVGEASTGDISHCLNAGGMGRQDFETETLVTHALRGEGFDASEDGTGRGTPLVPVAFSAKDHGADASVEISPTLRAMPHHESHANGGGQMAVAIPLLEIGKRTGVSTDDPRAGLGIGEEGDPMYTLQAGAQHGVAYPLDLRNAGRDPDKHDTVNRQGLGLGEDGDPSPTISTAFVPGVAAYAFQPRIGRNGRGDMGDVVNALTMSGETGKGDTSPCVAVFYNGETYGPEAEPYAVEALRALRRAVGEEALAIWGLGILASLQPPKILQPRLHDIGIRPPAFSRSWVVYCALSRQEDDPGWLLQSLRETGCAGCPPQGWQPSEQLTRELGAYLSKLSYPGSQAERFMHDLWRAAEGFGILREALSAVQDMGRSVCHQTQSVCACDQGRRSSSPEDLQGLRVQCQVPCERILREACAASGSGNAGNAAVDEAGDNAKSVGDPPLQVRRLTCEEAEFLQGFPRGYTRVPWKKKPAEDCPDGPRYKALGNSMAVNVMRWIGERIAAQLGVPPESPEP